MFLRYFLFYATIHFSFLQGDLTSEPLVLDLSGAISRALNCNRQLLGTVEGLTQAQYGIDLAESEFSISMTPNSQASFVGGDKKKATWTVGGGVEISKKMDTGTTLSVQPSIVKSGKEYLTGVQTTITQPLFRGLGKEYQLASLRGAQFALRTAYRDLYLARVQLIIRTIEALYEVIKIEKSLSFHQESYERIEQFYLAAKVKERVGLSSGLDVYRAEIELRHAQETLKGAKERLEEAKDLIRDLLALPLDCSFTVDVPLSFSFPSFSLDEAIEMALKNRIEMDQSQDEWQENRRLSRLAKKNLYPELNLVLNYSNGGHARNFARSWSHHRENVWGIGLTTSDFDPLADQIAYEQSLINISSASRGIDQIETKIVLEVKKVFRQLDLILERMHLQEDQIKTAQGELHLAKVKFDHGISDNFNVLQAEKSLAFAEQNHWKAFIDHIVGKFQLLAILGILIDKPCIVNF